MKHSHLPFRVDQNFRSGESLFHLPYRGVSTLATFPATSARDIPKAPPPLGQMDLIQDEGNGLELGKEENTSSRIQEVHD
jgi:hypothetical protein